MFPTHCNQVNVRDVSFRLTAEEIIRNSLGKKVYGVTNYVILTDGDGWAVTRIEKNRGYSLFKRIENVEIISLPHETLYVEDPSVDVLNPTSMAERAEQMGVKTLVVKGKFDHVSFIKEVKSESLIVFEVVPPNPPKLTELAARALSIGRINMPIKIITDILNLGELAKTRLTSHVMYPCVTSELSSDENTLFLDRSPDISSIGVENITLVGCELTLRTFSSLYGEEPAFLDMCPKKRAMAREENAKHLARCCMLDDGYRRSGEIAHVSWGATISHVEEAILDLFDLYE